MEIKHKNVHTYLEPSTITALVLIYSETELWLLKKVNSAGEKAEDPFEILLLTFDKFSCNNRVVP